jgi:hypothetical protein
MTKLLSIVLSAAFAFCVAVPASAQNTPSIDRRERRQQRRIHQGVRRGTLTRREAARLERQQARTRRLEARAKSDGRITRRERLRLQRRENRTSRHIYRQKHDRQNRR